MRIAKIRLTPELISDLLKLPGGVVPTNAVWNVFKNALEITIHGERCPDTREGDEPMFVSSDYFEQ